MIYNDIFREKNVAEEIFERLKENGSKPYCAIIRGMCKFYHVSMVKIYSTIWFNNLKIVLPIEWTS